MEWKTISEAGNRDMNEDSVGTLAGENGSVFIVADGLGGHGKGDVASSLAVTAFEDVFSTTDGGTPASLLSEAFQKAQAAILTAQKSAGSSYQMKTTACALAIHGDRIAWGHIGDSRLYAFAHNRVKFRTLDHSVPQMLVLSHEIKEKDIRNHPDRNRLLRVLGIAGESPNFELSEEYDLRRFQAFLLCSDGFWELILEKEMCALLKKSSSADEWLQKMRQVVEERGADADMDNYSAIAILVKNE